MRREGKRRETSAPGSAAGHFGQVLCGRARIMINAPEGSRIVFEYFEILDENGNYINTMFAPQKDIVTAEKHPMMHEAVFTFHGFRYIRIEGNEIPKEDAITTGIETYTGEAPISSAAATPVKHTWLRPSPIKESRLSTKNTPSNAQITAAKEPANSPRCTKP